MPSDMELIEAATKEGIDFNGPPLPSREEAKVGDEKSVSPAETPKPKETATVGEKTAQPEASEDNLPFHKHPRFKQILTENKSFKKQLEDMRRQYDERLQQMQRPAEPQIPDEQKQAVLQLARIFKQVPEFAKELGLDQIEAMRKENDELKSSHIKESYTKEKKDILDYVQKLGYDSDEVQDEINEAYGLDDIANYSPGSYRVAFRDLFWDRMDELKERAINLKQIEEKKKLKSGNSEIPSQPTQKAARKLSGNTAEDIAALIDEAGGVENIDFNS